MSEDDNDLIGPDGQGSARVDRDRRAPRFSWTPAYEATFFRSLCESVQLGLRENSSFKAEAWERAALALQDSHNAYPAKSHLINKSDNARKRFRLWRGLREDPDFAYNAVTRTVTATEEAWRAHIEREPLSRALRGRPFEHEDFMEVLYPDVVGSGGAPKRIMKPRRRTDGQLCDDPEMPGTGVLNLQPDTLLPHTGQPVMESPGHQRPSLSLTPTASSSNSVSQPRPTTTTLPPQANPIQVMALTPPDEPVSQTRKRSLQTSSTQASSDGARPSSGDPLLLAPPSSSSPEKRQRTSSHSNIQASVTTTAVSPPLIPPANMSPVHAVPVTHTEAPHAVSTQTALEEFANLLKVRGGRQWREEALDLFFKDFADENLDLQIMVSENMLSNEHKAMMFCKMPSGLRQHWVKRIREMNWRGGA